MTSATSFELLYEAGMRMPISSEFQYILSNSRATSDPNNDRLFTSISIYFRFTMGLGILFCVVLYWKILKVLRFPLAKILDN